MNPQAQAWAGPFGDEYTKRSPGDPRANRSFFRRALGPQIVADRLQAVIEFGAGVGSNLVALRELLPRARLDAVEINPMALEALIRAEVANAIYQSSMTEWINPEPGQYDLAFTKGVLIHIPPSDLPAAYDALHQASRRYVLVAEYYAPKPTAIEYRGQPDLLWKRDFAGELLDRHQDLQLIDYGFVYHRDEHPQDDLNWFLMERKQPC